MVMLCRKYLKITEANKNKNEAKFKFQGQSERSQRWFGIGFYWIGKDFSTREPELYRKIFLRNEKTQHTNTFKFMKSQR